MIEKVNAGKAPFIDRNFVFQNWKVDETEKEGKQTFAETLTSVLGQVNQVQLEAEEAVDSMLTGNLDNIHQVMIKTEEARLSLQLTGQVVNKVLDAYQEVSRMQI